MPIEQKEMDMLVGFIMSERFHYADDDNNRFAFALGQAVRYYGFLLIVLDRYQKASKKMISIFDKSMKLMPQTGQPVPVTVEQLHLMEESSRLTTLVHLEIESFYVFAKVFLDSVALFLYVHFGQARRVGLTTHHRLAEYHEEYLKVKGLVVPQGLSESIMLLKERICNYRDDEIVHKLSLRKIRATAWAASKNARIVRGELSLRRGGLSLWLDGRTAMSEELPQLREAINIYIRQIITLIESNREK